MFNFEDRWWIVAIAMLLALWVMGLVIPVRLVAPAVSSAQHFVDLEDDSPQDLPPPPRPPSLLLPVLLFMAGLGLAALSLYKRIAEPEGGNRWTWMAAAAGISAGWGIILMLMTMRLR